MEFPKFKIHKKRDVRMRDSIIALESILSLRIDETIKKELIKTCIWNYTHANGKYKTRYISEGSLKREKDTKIQHEHVIERNKLISNLLSEIETPEIIMSKSISCVVTKDEHAILTRVSKENPKLNGWERYKKANIRVFDLENEVELDFTRI